jgi:hypothetical protein
MEDLKMFCQHCGAIVPDGVTFCEDCSRKMSQQQQAAPGDAYAGQQPVYSPPVSDYLGQQSGQPRYASPSTIPTAQAAAASRRGKNAQLASIFGWCTATVGALVFLTTFLPWLSGGLDIIQGPSGWTLMVKGSELGGNFIWIKIPGLLYFSGLWSMLAGLAIIAGAVMLLKRIVAGRLVAGIGGIIGVGAATVNIVMTYNYQLGVAFGGWLFLVFCVLAVVGTELTFRYID